MKKGTKALILGVLLSFGFSPSVLADKPTIETMEIKLANLEVDITKKKLELIKREEKLNEMKVKSHHSNKIDKKNMALKLAEVEAALAKDKLLLSEREVKLYEMKVALLKEEK
ncbi:MAG TPA: hypothetical protein ENK39_00300 [Epsilonproteobacteria bacterium]|nr:hypothetical protein [Campylobacterota bacterium]